MVVAVAEVGTEGAAPPEKPRRAVAEVGTEGSGAAAGAGLAGGAAHRRRGRARRGRARAMVSFTGPGAPHRRSAPHGRRGGWVRCPTAATRAPAHRRAAAAAAPDRDAEVGSSANHPDGSTVGPGAFAAPRRRPRSPSPAAGGTLLARRRRGGRRPAYRRRVRRILRTVARRRILADRR